MSVLSDDQLRQEIEGGHIGIDPYRPHAVQPSSIDVRIDRFFRVFVDHGYAMIDPKVEQPGLTEMVEVERVFMLQSGQFALASTIEYVTVPDNLVSRLDGKSSLGRLGLQVHATAGWIDPGFEGTVTLELYNVAPLPICLYPGMPIGQLSFMPVYGEVTTPYGEIETSKYQGSRGPVESAYWKNFVVDDPEG